MSYEATFILIKPEILQRGLEQKILEFIEDHDFNIVALQRGQLTKEVIEQLYQVHTGKSFFNDLVSYILSGPVIVSIIEGQNAIKTMIDITGPTDPAEDPDHLTIRGIWGTNKSYNAIHRSDSLESFTHEHKIFFPTWNPSWKLKK